MYQYNDAVLRLQISEQTMKQKQSRITTTLIYGMHFNEYFHLVYFLKHNGKEKEFSFTPRNLTFMCFFWHL